MRTITMRIKGLAAICLSFIITLSAYTQESAPLKMSYQAVVRDGANKLLENKTIGMRISILQGSATGSLVYSETHSPTTNVNGLVSIIIGEGRATAGAIALIDWSQGPFFAETEIDPTGGSNYSITSTTQLLSVPFALYAEKAGNVFDGEYESLSGKPVFSQVATSGSYEDLNDKPAFADVATLGTYESLSNAPVLADVAKSGSYKDLSEAPVLAPVAESGKYADLLGAPALAKVATSGSYKDLADTLKFEKVATSGKFEDLLEKPSIPTKVSDLNNDLKFLTSEKQELKLENNSLSLTDANGKATSTITLPTGTVGDYNALINKPEGNNDGDILYWNKSNARWNILPMGAEGQVLSVINGELGWKTLTNINATTNYAVGDIYYEGEVPAGIVFELSQSGGYGKIISLKKLAAKAAWSTEEAVTQATDAEDGNSNFQKIKDIVDWGNKYPAFKASNDFGDGWYIPSKLELSAIYNQKATIAATLEKIDGSDALSESIYWSSSEDEEDSKNAFAVVFNDTDNKAAGELPSLSKKELHDVLPIRLLSRQEISNKPVEQEKVYAVGDIYKDENGTPIGVVYEITYNGLHGKIVSITETENQWSSKEIEVKANSAEDGKLNTQTVLSDLDNYPAFKFTAELGDGWYLPALEELKAVYRQKQGINLSLSSVPKAQLLKDNFYWSSTEKEGLYSIGVAFGNYKITIEGEPNTELTIDSGSSFETSKTESHYTRAIREF